MTLYDILSQLHTGTIVSVLVLLLSLIEVTPIPLHPLQWLGKRANKDIMDKVNSLDNKLSEHVCGSYRTQILDFSDCVMAGQIYTHDKWRAMLRICAEYEKMIKENNLINGDATEAIEYIRFKYQEVAQNGCFVTLPIVRKNEKDN